MELSWDGSIISMSEVNPPPSRSSSHSRGPPHPPPARTSSQLGLRSAFESAGDAQATLLPSPPERAYLSSSTLPSPTFASASPDPPPPLDPRGPAPPDAPAQHRPPLAHSLSHPLASFLHDSLSPPSSPTASVASSSFPGGSRTRLSSCAGASSAFSSHEASPRSRSARRRTRARSRSRTGSGSASSTASTDGSAHEDRAGELSSEDDHHGHASGLVMPSLHLDAARAPPRHSSSSPERAPARAHERDAPSPLRSARLLVLGKSADDRRTLARLVAGDEDDHEDDLRRTTSAASVAGATDMSFSYLSFRPASSSSRERSASSARAAAAATAECASGASSAFEPLAHAAEAPIALWHPARDEVDADAAAGLVDELTRPLERLEAKLARAYPATTGLAQVVEAAGCGEFEACLFLFSSPPLASEIALARPISHVLPLLPVLVLPPSPTGKPQKTTALAQAVQEQLNTAGVRWAPALAPPRSAATCTSPLYMLPHDLFVQHARDDHDDESHRVPRLVPSTSVASMPASSPESEDAPPSSLSSSQEFVTPLHPHPASSYYTSAGSSVVGDHREREFGPSSASAAAGRGAARSLSASSRAGSSSSRSSSPRAHGHAPTRSATHTRRRNLSLSSFASSSAGAPPSLSAASSSTSLADLHRLQSLVQDPAAPVLLRARRARAFLEWREVEVAARVSSGGARADAAVEVPEVWGERALDDVEEGGGTGRRMLDFSRRVAERRRVLARRTAGPSAVCGPLAAGAEQDGDGDVLAASDDDDEHEHEAGRATGASFATEPMTPRCAHRPLLSPLTTRTTPASSDSYFPAVATTTSPVDPLASSTHSLAPSTSTCSSSSSGAPSSALATSSVLVLPSSDPFHLPSLLHLVGLNLRLAVFAPTFASTAASSAGSSASRTASSSSSSSSRSASEKREAEQARQEGGGTKQGAPRPWAWWRTAAVVGLVFAAGVAVGTVVASASASGQAQVVGPAAWASRGRL